MRRVQARVLELPARAVKPTVEEEVKNTVGKTIGAQIEAKLGDSTSEDLAAKIDVKEKVKEQAKSPTKQSKQVRVRETKDAVKLTANTTKAASSDAQKTSMIQVASKHLVTRRQTTTNPKPAAVDPINRLLSRESGPVVVFVGDGSNVSAPSIQAKQSTVLAKPVAGRAIPARRKVSSQVPPTVATDSVGSKFPKHVPVPRVPVGRLSPPLRSDANAKAKAKAKSTDLVGSVTGKAADASVGQHDQKLGAVTPQAQRKTQAPTQQVAAKSNAPVADKTKDTVPAASKSKLGKSHDTNGVSASTVASKIATVSKDNDEQAYNSFSTFPVIRFVELPSGSAGRNAMTTVAPNQSVVAAAGSKKPSLPLRAASKTNGARRGQLALLPAVADENENIGFIPAPNSVVAKKLGDKPPVPGTPNQFTPLELSPSSATAVVPNPTLSAAVKPLGKASQPISSTENTDASQKLSSALATQLVTQLPAEVTTLPLVPTALEPAPERVRAVALEPAREQTPKSTEIASVATNPGNPILPQTQSTKPIAISRFRLRTAF